LNKFIRTVQAPLNFYLLVYRQRVNLICFKNRSQESNMAVKENIELLERWYREVWREAKDETIFELLASDASLHGQTGPEVEIKGPEGFIAFAKQIRESFPDIEVVVYDIFGMDEDERVAARWVAKGKHTGDGMGVPPSGKSISICGMTIARIRNGKIVEGWDSWDRLGMLEQIGAYAPPELAKTA
jgi:steroid delta-isomerase-like uncharacterized protein